jgi:hypothetical protein
LELLPFFHQLFKILILFVLYFKNYKRQMVSWNCKQVQHVKIYLPCNFEVNLITHIGVIALLTSISYRFWNKGRKLLKFRKFDEKRAITPKWVLGFTSKLQGRKILTCCNFLQFKLTDFGYSNNQREATLLQNVK